MRDTCVRVGETAQRTKGCGSRIATLTMVFSSVPRLNNIGAG
jgi:hypothetical protein